jgi:hypothetical protein
MSDALSAALLERAKREQQRRAQTTPSWTENIWGKGEADTPGERLGQTINDMGGEFFKGAGRGARDLAMFLGSAGRPDVSENARAAILPKTEFLNRDAQTQAGTYAGTVGEFAPGVLMGASPYAVAAAGTASEAAGQAARGKSVPDFVPFVGGSDAEPVARTGAALLAGGGAQALDDGLRQRAATTQYIKEAPPADTLRQQASDLYQQASARGVVASSKQFDGYKRTLEALAKNRGFITPKGSVVGTAPELRAAIRSLDDYAGVPLTVDNLQAIRTQLQVVAESATPKISAMGVKLIRQHDDFVSKLAPELKTANALYTRAKRGDMMDQVDDLADIRASQFSQSGMENALRTEYRALDRRIARGTEKGLRPDQIDAVRGVSRGTPASNMARGIGKAAPTGVVSVAGAGGVPFLMGNAIGGPAVGSAMAAASMGTGILGRQAATSMQQRAAEYASAAMRSGVPMDQIQQNLGGGLFALMVMDSVKNTEGQSAQ